MNYKQKAIQAAQADSKEGFRFHIWRNPLSDRICKLIEVMAANHEPKSYRDEIEAVWESNLAPLPKFNGWGKL